MLGRSRKEKGMGPVNPFLLKILNDQIQTIEHLQSFKSFQLSQFGRKFG